MGHHAPGRVVAMFLAFMFPSACAVKATELSASNCLPNSIAHPSASRSACHPLLDAVKADSVVLVKLRLTEGADVNEIDQFGTPLHYAAARNSAVIAEVLIDAGANLEAEAVENQRRGHPLHTAAMANAVAVAELLIRRGAQVNARNAEGATPLSVAASNGKAEIAKVLLKAGANPLTEDSGYDTPIHVAAVLGRLNVVQVLLSSGVNINLRSSHNGETPLYEATKKDWVNLIAFLLARGADPNIATNDGKRPLQLAGNAQIRGLLLKYGAK